MQPRDDFAACMGDVARALLGEPNKALSGATQLRFGSRGSLSIDLVKGVWHDHEAGTGGGVIDLVARETGCMNGDAVDWLRDEGFLTEREEQPQRGRIVAEYGYRDEAGELLFQVVRFEPKDFRQRRPDGNGGWIWRVKGVRQVPYRLFELRAKVAHNRVFIVEGEKDVDRLAALGLVATCNAGGAGSWPTDLNAHFRGLDVVVLPDNDEPGRSHAETVARNLAGIAERVRIVALPDLPLKGDVSDWLAAGGSVADLVRLADAATGPEAEDEMRDRAGGADDAGPGGGADDAGPGGGADDAGPGGGAGPAMLSAAEFLAKWKAPDFIVDGVVQRGYLYSFCGKTGHGKTAAALLLAVCVAAGMPFAGHDVARGRVVYLAGENPDDVRTRLLIMGEVLGIDVAALDLHFVDGAFDLAASLDALAETIARIGGAQLVIVDTAAAHFRGDDENSNTELGGFARELRRICTMEGAPAVVVPAHPIKHASAKTDLLPRGGGAFIAEVDGNLTCFSGDDGETAEVHWTGKIRGASFEPFALRLERRVSALLKDAKGRAVHSVVAVPMTEDDLAKVQDSHASEQDHLLETMLHYPKASLADWCERMGWINADRAPLKTKIFHRMQDLVAAKLAVKNRSGKYVLTKKGTAEARELTER